MRTLVVTRAPAAITTPSPELHVAADRCQRVHERGRPIVRSRPEAGRQIERAVGSPIANTSATGSRSSRQPVLDQVVDRAQVAGAASGEQLAVGVIGHDPDDLVARRHRVDRLDDVEHLPPVTTRADDHETLHGGHRSRSTLRRFGLGI